MTPGLNFSLSACVSQLRIQTMMLDTVLAERKDFKTRWPIKTTKCDKSELHAVCFGTKTSLFPSALGYLCVAVRDLLVMHRAVHVQSRFTSHLHMDK